MVKKDINKTILDEALFWIQKKEFKRNRDALWRALDNNLRSATQNEKIKIFKLLMPQLNKELKEAEIEEQLYQQMRIEDKEAAKSFDEDSLEDMEKVWQLKKDLISGKIEYNVLAEGKEFHEHEYNYIDQYHLPWVEARIKQLKKEKLAEHKKEIAINKQLNDKKKPQEKQLGFEFKMKK